MADLDVDPQKMSPTGHTEPISSYRGSKQLRPELRITVGPREEVWEVIRVDEPVDDEHEGVFHLRRP